MEHHKSSFKWTKIKNLVAYSSGRGKFSLLVTCDIAVTWAAVLMLSC